MNIAELADRVYDATLRVCGTADGSCYVASEALYLLAGGKAAGLTPVRGVARVRHRRFPDRVAEAVHWWLRTKEGEVIDLTAEQYLEPFPYEVGRGRGFFPQPSTTTRAIMEAV